MISRGHMLEAKPCSASATPSSSSASTHPSLAYAQQTFARACAVAAAPSDDALEGTRRLTTVWLEGTTKG